MCHNLWPLVFEAQSFPIFISSLLASLKFSQSSYSSWKSSFTSFLKMFQFSIIFKPHGSLSPTLYTERVSFKVVALKFMKILFFPHCKVYWLILLNCITIWGKLWQWKPRKNEWGVLVHHVTCWEPKYFAVLYWVSQSVRLRSVCQAVATGQAKRWVRSRQGWCPAEKPPF